MRDCGLCRRPRCKHWTKCPSCGEGIYQFTEPVLGYATSNEAWLCLWCPIVVCIWGYATHTQAIHRTS